MSRLADRDWLQVYTVLNLAFDLPLQRTSALTVENQSSPLLTLIWRQLGRILHPLGEIENNVQLNYLIICGFLTPLWKEDCIKTFLYCYPLIFFCNGNKVRAGPQDVKIQLLSRAIGWLIWTSLPVKLHCEYIGGKQDLLSNYPRLGERADNSRVNSPRGPRYMHSGQPRSHCTRQWCWSIAHACENTPTSSESVPSTGPLLAGPALVHLWNCIKVCRQVGFLESLCLWVWCCVVCRQVGFHE